MKRHSIFTRGLTEKNTHEPPRIDCPINLYMDESGNGGAVGSPLIVGAVVTDIDASEIESRVQQVYSELAAMEEFEGFPAFETFRADGFHAAVDSYEWSVPFFRYIHSEVGFKVYMTVTNRSSLSPSDEKSQIEHMYADLVADNLLRYNNYPELRCYIEENDSLHGISSRLPKAAEDRAINKLGRQISLPPIKVQVVKKNSIMSLALIDYAMIAVYRWAKEQYRRDPSKRGYREFRLVEPTISLLYSLELGIISSRKVNLHGSS